MKKNLVIGFLKLFAFLPLRALYVLSDIAFLFVYYIYGYRRKIVRKNLSEAFPEKDIKELRSIEKRYYRFLCDIMVETIKLLHISDKELMSRIQVHNASIVNESLSKGTSAVVFLGHYGNWEWVQEISRYFVPEAYPGSIYHRMKQPFWDDIFLTIRSRWGAHIVEQDAAIRTLLNRSNFPWVFGFIADQRPKYNNPDNCVEFLNHPTWFITGPETIGSKVKADFFYLDITRPERGKYNLTFIRLESESDGNPYPVTRRFWKEFEKTIQREPSLWLWSHNRWKHKPSQEEVKKQGASKNNNA